ncbi:MAG: hypothetical protein JNK19_06255 [Tabrizicola sp.]|nr:hypothetical protein [Tabrizicola sp.]
MHSVKAVDNGLVDYVRFAAALSIVWFSIDVPGNWLAKVAIPLFLVLLLTDSESGFATSAARYLKPFVIWSGVYALLKIAFAIKAQDPPLGWWDWPMVLTGTWIHLWMLPFVFVTTLLAPWLRHPLASLGAALLVVALLAGKGTPIHEPWLHWSFGAIPVFVAIGFLAWGWRLAATTLGLSFLVLYLGRPSPENFTILAGTALALIVLSYRLPTTPLSQHFARLSLVIYLAHPLIIIVGQSLRITWVELGLFSIVGSVILALIIDSVMSTAGKGRAGP